MDPRVSLALNRVRNQPFYSGDAVPFGSDLKSVDFTADGFPFAVTQAQLSQHQIVLGTTGSGKSKYLELLVRHLFDHLQGVTIIDPHGDTVDAVLEYVAAAWRKTGDDSLLERVHYLQPSFETVFQLDPFAFPDDGLTAEQRPFAEAAWLHATADRIVDSLLRDYTKADIDIMTRLLRWLRNLMIGVGIHAGTDTHLSLADVLVLLDIKHPRHRQVLAALRPHLPPEVAADFQTLHSLKRPKERDEYTESTANRLRSFLSPLVQALFIGKAPSINLKEILQKRQMLLINLRETDFLSARQGRVIAGLLIQQLKSLCARLPEVERTPHYLIIDEAAEYLAEDMETILTQARKWGLRLCLAGQSLRTFRRGEVDLFEVTEDNCNLFVSFRQRAVSTVDRLGRFFARPNRILEERLDVRDRPDGYDFIELEARNRSKAIQTGQSNSSAKSESESKGNLRSTMSTTANTMHRSEAVGSQESINRSTGTSITSSNNMGQGSGMTMGMRPEIINGQTVLVPMFGESANNFFGSGEGRGEFSGEGHGIGVSNVKGTGSADTVGAAESVGTTDGQTTGVTESQGTNRSETETEGSTLQKTPLAKSREELHPTGQPRFGIDYQDEAYCVLLTRLPDRYALTRVKTDSGDRTFLVRTAEVVPSPNIDGASAREFRDRLLAVKPYIVHAPELPAAGQNQRIDAFLTALDAAAKNLPTDPPRNLKSAPDESDDPFDT